MDIQLKELLEKINKDGIETAEKKASEIILNAEKKAADISFSTIYKRSPNMDNPNDNAAVTVIAYGLRPANRDMENEKKAIKIYKSIFKKAPTKANDWDLVRAIAYSGAVR